MEISTETRNGALIAKAEGRIDGANARDFESAVQSAVRDCEVPVIIDCENLSYISSAGLRAILLLFSFRNHSRSFTTGEPSIDECTGSQV